LLLEKLPLMAMSAAAAVVTLAVQQGGGAAATLAEVPLGPRVENAVAAYAAYVIQFFWPSRLAVLYPYATGVPAASAALLAVITAAVIWQRKRRPWLFAGWFWFGGILMPAIGLVQVGLQGRADRYMYIPLIGLAIIVAQTAGHRPLPIALAAAACCAYAFVAWQTAGYWRDTVTLFRHAVDVTDGNWAAMNILGHALLEEDRVDEAMPYVTEAVRLRSNLAETRIDFGAALSKKGDFPGAEAQYRAALASDADNADAREGLGVVLTEQGRYGEALPNLQAAAKSKPGDADAHYNLGRLYGLSGQPDLAIAEFGECVRLQPNDAAAHFNLGAAYVARERIAEACDQFREALRLKPEDTAAQRAVETCASSAPVEAGTNPHPSQR
jgi:Flp pilus assembly protein TadD